MIGWDRGRPATYYAESVGEFKRRVALWQPWDQKRLLKEGRNPEGVASIVGESQQESLFADDGDPRFQSKHVHPTRAARVGTPAWAEIRQGFQRYA